MIKKKEFSGTTLLLMVRLAYFLVVLLIIDDGNIVFNITCITGFLHALYGNYVQLHYFYTECKNEKDHME